LSTTNYNFTLRFLTIGLSSGSVISAASFASSITDIGACIISSDVSATSFLFFPFLPFLPFLFDLEVSSFTGLTSSLGCSSTVSLTGITSPFLITAITFCLSLKTVSFLSTFT
jgi:hypothetical protein